MKTKDTVFTYKALCYCKCCGMPMRPVKLITNYALEDDEPSVYSRKMCRACRTGEID